MELFLHTENTRLRPQTRVNKGSCITSSGRAEQFLLLAPFPCTGLSTQTSRTKAKCCSLECSHGMNLNSSSQLGTASHPHRKSTWMMSLFSTELGIVLLPLEALFHGALTLTLCPSNPRDLNPCMTLDFCYMLTPRKGTAPRGLSAPPKCSLLGMLAAANPAPVTQMGWLDWIPLCPHLTRRHAQAQALQWWCMRNNIRKPILPSSVGLANLRHLASRWW